MKSGIFGGTFDPIHKGHLHVADVLLGRLGLDRIILVPAAAPPHKAGLGISPFAIRLKWIAQCISGHPGLEVSEVEEKKGLSYTCDTVAALRELYPEDQFWLIMGSDMSAIFSTWKDYRGLLDQVNPVVVTRPGCPVEIDPHLDRQLALLFENSIQRIDALDISSTQIRQRLAKGEDVSDLVPHEIADEVYAQSVKTPNK